MKILAYILWPLSMIYSLIMNIRNFMFDKEIFKATKIDKKVISIGNIHVGGTGKTPAVIYLVEYFQKFNFKPAVLSRGYKRKSKGYVLVSDGFCITKDVEKVGDEIYLTAKETNCAAAVCEKRVIGAKKLIEDTNPDVIILDDAFQHRWIKRDLDIVLIDANTLVSNDIRNKLVLPAGYLRESFKNIKRADIVIINHKFYNLDIEKVKEKIDKIPYLAGKLILHSHYKVENIVDLKFNSEYSLEEFIGQKALAVSGIANPESFFNILENNNLHITEKLIFTDHKNYTQDDIEQIRQKFYSTNSTCVITTQKDFVKLSNFQQELDDIDFFFIKIKMHIKEAEKLNKFLLS
ncbi:MAG TPA: tetraacyldisaccharide 4'-kinase [Ignavibacteriales bacterium]|nr:tetraacyldisaccharide 4'-kinase [Ignavibacteriales bacterium]HPD67095.1 tetraacyldisaccharide 4'-kinase [Ignavibacteriales bacterium]HRR19009.1 tetraacyldisaccharide 4'-kinase [Ignavibacteriales bacterium]HRT99517.1 tetraacyldisaccharide 4'-kinase [Ignavibacteriales bacterium]